MPLPNNFSQTEHFQDVARKLFNREIRDYFSDVTSAELDLNSPRSSLRSACTHQDADSVLMTIGRMMLFEMAIKRDFEGSVPAAPTHKVIRKGIPQVILYFLEDDNDIEPGYRAVDGRISYRLMDEKITTLSKSKLTTLGHRIKTEFGNGGGYLWKKGRKMFSYTDWENGYQLQLLCRSEADGRTLTGKILDLGNNTPDWALAKLSENLEEAEAYPIIPPKELIFGEQQRMPRARPTATVRFQYAAVECPGLPNRTIIFDRSGKHRTALVTG
jgi:hypothetical protein